MKKCMGILLGLSLLCTSLVACAGGDDSGLVTEPVATQNEIVLQPDNAAEIANSATHYSVVDVTEEWLATADGGELEFYAKYPNIHLSYYPAELPREESMTAQEAADIAGRIGEVLTGLDMGQHDILALCCTIPNYQDGKRQVWHLNITDPEPITISDPNGLDPNEITYYQSGTIYIDAISGEFLYYAHSFNITGDLSETSRFDPAIGEATIREKFGALGLGDISKVELELTDSTPKVTMSDGSVYNIVLWDGGKFVGEIIKYSAFTY